MSEQDTRQAESLREQMARLIDGDAFWFGDADPTTEKWLSDRRRIALAKADAILSIPQIAGVVGATPTQDGGER